QKPPAFHPVEQQDRAAENLPFIQRLQRSGHRNLSGVHRDFHISRFKLFHAATQHDSSAVYEHQVCENVLQFLYLVRCHDNSAATVEVIVQQGIVELLPKQNVEPQRRLVQHQQSRVNRHDQRKVQLRHHPFG